MTRTLTIRPAPNGSFRHTTTDGGTRLTSVYTTRTGDTYQVVYTWGDPATATAHRDQAIADFETRAPHALHRGPAPSVLTTTRTRVGNVLHGHTHQASPYRTLPRVHGKIRRGPRPTVSLTLDWRTHSFHLAYQAPPR